MDVKTTRAGEDMIVVSAAGRIDHQTAEAFREALEPCLQTCSAEGDSIILDMAEVDYISSVGLRVLLMASKRASKQNGRIAVAAMQPTVAEVFRISRFDTILPAYDSISAAEAGVKG